MRLCCGAASIQAMKAFAESGVTEVFCGVQLPEVSSSFFRILNRREIPHANLKTFDELEEFVGEARRLQLRVFVTLNEIFTAPQYPFLIQYLERLKKIPIDGLIVSDFAFLLYLYHECKGRFHVHMGTGALSLNPHTVALFKRYGARRVVLSRKIFTHEIAAIARECHGIEFEVFMETSGFCPNFDGLCNYLHNNWALPFGACKDLENNFLIAPNRDRMHVKNHGCKLCAIWDYCRLGIDCMKIPSREKDYVRTLAEIHMIRDLEEKAHKIGKEDYVAEAQLAYYTLHGSLCPGIRGCHLSEDFSSAANHITKT